MEAILLKFLILYLQVKKLIILNHLLYNMKIRVFPEVLEVISISFIYNSGFSGKKIFRQIKDENTCL